MIETLERILPQVDRSAASLETAFLRAGASLGRGIDMLEQFSASVVSFSDELSNGAMANASVSLEDLARALHYIAGLLPADAETLNELADRNEAVAKRFDAILEKMRMMTILARSARIESVVFDSGFGLEAFSHDAIRMTRSVQKDMGLCAADHAKLTRLLRKTADQQVALDNRFRARLIALESELSGIFQQIKERQEIALRLIQDVAERSKQIAGAAGMALLSLQSGDATRQRLEHVSTAIKHAIDCGDDSDPGTAAGGDEHRLPTTVALCRLQDAQLRDAMTDFGGETSVIEAALSDLVKDTSALLADGQAAYGSTGDGSDSFLSVFKAKLLTAADLLLTCQTSRRSVADAMATLRTMLADLNQIVERITATGADLVVLGLNAGIKAIRIGTQGRSLTVIADELKRLASEISLECNDLIQAFTPILEISLRLDRQADAAGTASTADMSEKIGSIFDEIDLADQQVAGFAASMEHCAECFNHELIGGSEAFQGAITMQPGLLEAAAALAELADGAACDEEALTEGFRHASAMMMAVYTMEGERRVHAEISGISPDEPGEFNEETDDGIFGLSDESSEATEESAAPADEWEIDDRLVATG